MNKGQGTAVLYHYPLACSSAARIAAAEGGVALHVQHVDLYSKILEDGRWYFDINPMGQVPALETDDDQILTEGVAVLLWIQDHSANPEFRRKPESADYYNLLRWLAFCTSEFHKQILWPLFRSETPPEMKAYARDLAPGKFDHLDCHLASHEFVLGDYVSAADAYLGWALLLAKFAGLEFNGFEHLSEYFDRLMARAHFTAIINQDRDAVLEDRRKYGERAFAAKAVRSPKDDD